MASAGGAVIAALFAGASANTTKKALRLEQEREKRRTPALVRYLADGFCKRQEGFRLYAFSISVSNPSDVDNAIAMVELRVDYKILVIVDTSGRADIEELVRIHHQLRRPGDRSHQWGQIPGHRETVALFLSFVRPVESDSGVA